MPFCLKKCDYCSFYSKSLNSSCKENQSLQYDYKPIADYLEILLMEIEYYQSLYQIVPKTIYLGGGTPSLLSINDLERIIKKFDLSGISEITIEINPATVNISQLQKYKEIGINRLSIGVQSLIDKELSLMGRLHKVADIVSLYENGLDKVFFNISIDYIYGLPNQKLSDVEYSIKKIIELRPSHISIYCLSLEEGVPLSKLSSEIPSDDVVSQMYFHIINVLNNHDYIQYELSSFYKKTLDKEKVQDFVSIHNIAYWSGEQYLGFGACACGYVASVGSPFMVPSKELSDKKIIRYINHSITNYKQNDYIKEKLFLTETDIETEFIITGLRKTKGINISDFNKRFNVSMLDKYNNTIKKLSDQGMVTIDQNIKINKDYYFVSNEVLCKFV